MCKNYALINNSVRLHGIISVIIQYASFMIFPLLGNWFATSPFLLRSKSVVNPFLLRSKSVVNPFCLRYAAALLPLLRL